MKLRVWFFVILLLTSVGTLTADEGDSTIVLTLQPRAVSYSGTWNAKVVDKLARSWSTPDVTANDLRPVVLSAVPFDGILTTGLYEIEISNNLEGCLSEESSFLESILVSFPTGKKVVFRNISPSASGEKVHLSFLVYPGE